MGSCEREAIFASEQLIEASCELVRTPSVEDRLGTYAVQLTALLERSVAVGVDGQDYLDIPNRQREIIPVNARRIGQKAILHAYDSGLNQAQIDAIQLSHGDGKGYVAAKKTEQFFTESPKHGSLPTFEGRDQQGVTTNNLWSPNSKTSVHGRPVVLMNIDASVGEQLSPVVFLHEMTHVLQKERKPIQGKASLTPSKRAQNRLENELEANYAAVTLVEGMRDAKRLGEVSTQLTKKEMLWAIDTELTRRKYQANEDMPFYPNRPMVQALAEKDLIGEKITSSLLE